VEEDEDEDGVGEDPGLRISRESCTGEKEEEGRDDTVCPEDERDDDCPDVDERDDCPETAEETVSEMRGRICVRIVSIKEESPNEEDELDERPEDPRDDDPEDKLVDPEDDDDPEERLEDPRDDDGPEEIVEKETPLNCPGDDPEEEELEVGPDEMETGLGII